MWPLPPHLAGTKEGRVIWTSQISNSKSVVSTYYSKVRSSLPPVFLSFIGTRPHPCVYLSVAVLRLLWQNRVVATESIQLTKPKVLTIGSLQKKFADPSFHASKMFEVREDAHIPVLRMSSLGNWEFACALWGWAQRLLASNIPQRGHCNGVSPSCWPWWPQCRSFYCPLCTVYHVAKYPSSCW